MAFTAASGEAWIHVAPASGTVPEQDEQAVAISVTPTAATPPRLAPYGGTVTITPAAGLPVAIPVTFQHRSDVDVVWEQSPPPTINPGQRVSAVARATASISEVEVGIVACPASNTLSECGDTSIFEVIGNTIGPPGAFALELRRPECLSAGDYLVRPTVTLHTANGEIGPFLGPPVGTNLPAEVLRIVPSVDTLHFSAFGHTDPPPQRLDVSDMCAKTVNLAVTSSASWVRAFPVSTASGTALEVQVDLGGLDPQASPFEATLTLSSPAATAPATVRVVLDLAC